MNDQDLAQALDDKHNPDQDVAVEKAVEMGDFWWKLVHLDPSILRGAVIAVALLLGALGFAIDDQTLSAFLSAVAALLAMIQALWTRSAVTPNAKVVVYKPDPVNHPAELAPGEAVSSNVVAVANAAADTPGMDIPIDQLPFPERVQDGN